MGRGRGGEGGFWDISFEGYEGDLRAVFSEMRGGRKKERKKKEECATNVNVYRYFVQRQLGSYVLILMEFRWLMGSNTCLMGFGWESRKFH